MPTSMYTGPDTQFDDMPSEEQIDNWQQDQTKGPVVKEPVSKKDTAEPHKEEPPMAKSQRKARRKPVIN